MLPREGSWRQIAPRFTGTTIRFGARACIRAATIVAPCRPAGIRTLMAWTRCTSSSATTSMSGACAHLHTPRLPSAPLGDPHCRENHGWTAGGKSALLWQSLVRPPVPHRAARVASQMRMLVCLTCCGVSTTTAHSNYNNGVLPRKSICSQRRSSPKSAGPPARASVRNPPLYPPSAFMPCCPGRSRPAPWLNDCTRYTDNNNGSCAGAVVNRYFHDHFPLAIATAEAFRADNSS